MADTVERRAEKTEKMKEKYIKDVTGRKSGRPMGYIFPSRIKSILNGETPSISVSMHTPNADKEFVMRKPGDTWEEGGYIYIQHEGWLEKTTKNLVAMQEEGLFEPKKCSTCGSTANNHLDEKFLRIRNKCFNCNIKYETHLRLIGKYEDYEKKVMMNNALSFFKDAKQELEHYIDSATDVDIYFNDDGTQQKWVGNADRVKDHFRKELDDVNTEIKRLESDLEKVNASLEETTSGNN